ncbi:MAG TPA: 16S rRNA (cytosine(1402)-N(4))-methyltransferase RsmH [Candidatus Latescibacteria bacterium]|nr:16S rRNA (cytosine(1402)-N(4))-methyltransferase RsmH [Candidatus Latescibacterota bacterium]HJP29043.1 16S rRNA (cytosine(1402)-N(4))-methyltransferase RsmH [Candidatus Latescibacterota bacterium]
MTYHVPVMAEEVVAGLVVDDDGFYIDATAGGGGHGEAILQALGPSGHLLACDRDSAAMDEAGRRLAPHGGRVIFLQCAFSSLTRSAAPLLRQLSQVRPVAVAASGVLFDLGVSSHQIDVSQRGFSYHRDGPLDMRMDRSAGVPAGRLLAQIEESDLVGLIRRYGEERGARRIARSVCRARDAGELNSTADLTRAIEATKPQMLNKTLARVFQALRIAVNDELVELENGLDAAIELLRPGGRLAVISYHSLEDRIVKQKLAQLVKGCVCPPALPACACGLLPSFRAVSRRQSATPVEVEANPRARSAALRLYEKLDQEAL